MKTAKSLFVKPRFARIYHAYFFDDIGRRGKGPLSAIVIAASFRIALELVKSTFPGREITAFFIHQGIAEKRPPFERVLVQKDLPTQEPNQDRDFDFRKGWTGRDSYQSEEIEVFRGAVKELVEAGRGDTPVIEGLTKILRTYDPLDDPRQK